MKFPQFLTLYFASDVRSRAAAYVYGKAVRIVQASDAGIWATVRGNSTYNVTMKLESDGLHMGCTCPFYADRGVGCKHLWATVLTAYQQNLLSDLTRHEVDVIFDDEQAIDNLASDFAAAATEDDDDDANHLRDPSPRRPVTYKAKKRQAPKPPPSADWSRVFNQIKRSTLDQPKAIGPLGLKPRQLLYVIDGPSSATSPNLLLEIAFQERKKDGDWSKPKFQALPQQEIEEIHEGPDAAITPLLFGAQQQSYGYGYSYGHHSGCSRFSLSAARCRTLLPLLGQTGRLYLRLGSVKEEIAPIRWDDGPAWQLRLRVDSQDGGKNYQVTGWLCRGDERQPVTQPRIVTQAGLAIWNDNVAFIDDGGAPAWVKALRSAKSLHVSAKKKDEFLRDLLLMPQLPALELPEELQVAEERIAPKPKIVIRRAKASWRGELLDADLAFEYADRPIALSAEDRGIYDAETRRLLVRDVEAERTATAFLYEIGFRTPQHRYGGSDADFELAPRHLPKATRALLDAGWKVEAEGKLYRSSGAINIEVTTGIDWFDLEGNVQFDDQVAPLPRLLQALRKGENTVQLDDGTFGMLPDDWLKKYGMLAGLGSEKDGQLRFSKMQVGLLDALLASMPEVSVDEAFRTASEKLRRFDGIKAVDPPAEFVGTLREYQREGLGWLHFLERFGFGGCLADDMGLGKTVQILALLAGRANATKPKDRLPTLIVVPRSLVFNWQQEAARFTPQLKLLDHTGLARAKTAAQFPDFDIIITTYGTLRRDVLLFKDVKFDYCILDEAQIVKNAGTDQAKATRLLQANHRLALSGTPVENHLGELWSMFDFLNPGLLGRASVFKLAGGASRNPEPETRAILAKGLRPFILRRTKQQVAKDLPEKTEQTLFCELEPEQRKLYDELREHYRQSLAKTIEAVGMKRAKIQVLEALLRLRQAACHPGLIDKKKTADASAKLDMLFPYLEEAIDEGQKTLVFSQFTSFLAILRARLDKAGIRYEYLDGKTRNRQEKVEHFQNDPECKLFLISLKAGGVGLNLTAAEYVFLLDPWWNPAVEAQAIDRTHRIGQTKPVFAYRLIAKNTVEEKVLELQKTKRDLADAILNADNSVISDLNREDLELLLS